jgi:hypothetical protein
LKGEVSLGKIDRQGFHERKHPGWGDFQISHPSGEEKKKKKKKKCLNNQHKRNFRTKWLRGSTCLSVVREGRDLRRVVMSGAESSLRGLCERFNSLRPVKVATKWGIGSESQEEVRWVLLRVSGR